VRYAEGTLRCFSIKVVLLFVLDDQLRPPFVVLDKWSFSAEEFNDEYFAVRIICDMRNGNGRVLCRRII
jgi:hypothetical protein